MLCTHTAAGRGPEQAGASKGISLPLTLAELGMADVERDARNEGEAGQPLVSPEGLLLRGDSLNVDESEHIAEVV